MKYCAHCGKQILDEAVICVNCGCTVAGQQQFSSRSEPSALINTLSQKVMTLGIIWLVIGILQIFTGFALIVGVLNIISSVKNIKYSKELLRNPSNIVENFEPTTGPIIVLVYNVIFGGIIGVIGSIYYFVGIRNFVMDNKSAFEQRSGNAGQHFVVGSQMNISNNTDSTCASSCSTSTHSTAGWTCSCGRFNAPYTSTCVCGINKRNIKSPQ